MLCKLTRLSPLVPSFYVERIRSLRDRVTSAAMSDELSHPNGVYGAIKRFAMDYEYTLGDSYG